MSTTPAPAIRVACAIIEQDGLVLAAQRSGRMKMPLKWEFPGGKIDGGETPEECLKRELLEEMGIRIRTGRPLSVVSYDYGVFSVKLYPYICTIVSGEITLHEHRAISWLKPGDLARLDWAEADYPVIEEYLKVSHTTAR